MNNKYKYLKYKKKYLNLIGGVNLKNGELDIHDDCEICFENFIDTKPSDIILLCSNKHIFHRKCCEKIYNTKKKKDDMKCPMCRENIVVFSTLENRDEYINISEIVDTEAQYKVQMEGILKFEDTDYDTIQNTLTSMGQNEFREFKNLLYNSLQSYIEITNDDNDFLKEIVLSPAFMNSINDGNIDSITRILYYIFDNDYNYRQNIIFFNMLVQYIRNHYLNIVDY